jgi:hypothetical protein
MTIPVDGVAPILLAVLPISDSENHETLLPHLRKLLRGLIREHIEAVSYSSDGTELERKIQRAILNEAAECLRYTIKSPQQGVPDTMVTVPIIDSQPISLLQDSKHALKTLRNNLFSGARLLTLGNYTMLYSTIHDLAFANGSPLYRRDVEKLDRQDDNAASCLFAADTLSYLTNHYSDHIGEIVYLFVFGDLVDAYQNRSISHHEQVKILLRTRYFLDSWERFLKHAGYKRHLHFLSREAIDILRQIIEGLLGLIYIYQDHLRNPNDINPLLPWLHSTEQCEHIFGEARRIVEDFCFLDFIYMIPKLRVTIREAMLHARMDPRATASGYNHTYFDSRGLDIPTLSTFPSDDEINTVAKEGAEEAESLLALLSVSLKRLQGNELLKLPPATSLGIAKDENEDNDTVTEAQRLQDLISNAEKESTEDFLPLAEAAALVTADEFMKMYVLHYLTR